MKTIRYISSLVRLILLFGVLCIPQALASDISRSSFVYEGAFRVPQGSFGEASFSNNPFVNAQYQPMAYNPVNNSLFLGQATPDHTQTKRIGEISIPEIINPLSVDLQIDKLNIAAVLQAPQDISNGEFDKLNQDGSASSDPAGWGQLGGLYVNDNQLLGTAWSYYDASQSNGYRSHFTSKLSWLNGTGFSGMHAVGSSPNGSFANGGFVGGYLAKVPEKHRAAIGFPMLSGRTGGPIVGRSSFGPTLWGFDPGQLNFDKASPSTMFIGYPESHPTLGTYSDQASLMFNRSTGVTGVIWPENSDSILFFGSHGLGIEFDQDGLPLDNDAQNCSGPGTSDVSQAMSNTALKQSGVSSHNCGFQTLNSTDISNGLACCFDPVNSANTTHRNAFKIGAGTSCYGDGTRDHRQARTASWLKLNSPSGYQCGDIYIDAAGIAQDNACCFVGTNSTAKGGSSYPSVYQVWQYDIQDVLDVKSGAKAPWELLPSIWNFDLPFDTDDRAKQIFATAYDPENQRIFIGQSFGDGEYPIIHVFSLELDGAIAPPITPSPPQVPNDDQLCLPIKASSSSHVLICL